VEPYRASGLVLWRKADIRHNGQVGYLAMPALLLLETLTLTGTP